MEDYKQFCTACGKEMSSGMTYCPACGTPAPGVQGQQGNAFSQQNGMFVDQARNKVRFAAFLLFAGALFSLLIGIYAVASADSLTNMVFDTLLEQGYTLNMTEAEFKDMLVTSGYYLILCGVLCLIPGILAYTYRMWPITMILAVAATLVGFYTSIIGGVLGIIVCLYLYKYKEAFNATL